MPWIKVTRGSATVHKFEFLFEPGRMSSVGVGCSCGWRQGLRPSGIVEGPRYQWEQSHLKKLGKLTFRHEEDDVQYFYEYRNSTCECGWESPPGADFERSGRAHLAVEREREGS
jgi:hypothetical protein